jgi:hypothetical protein
MPEPDGLVRKGKPDGNRVVVLHSQVYIALFKLAVSRLPSRTLGVLLGEPGIAGESDAPRAWITVREAVPLSLISTPRGLAPDYTSRQNLDERLHSSESLQIVGLFYADPGIGRLGPGVSFRDLAQAAGSAMDLLLLVNPLTNEGAFYTVNAHGWEPLPGFYESGSTLGRRARSKTVAGVIPWHSEVRNAAGWLDALVKGQDPGEVPPGPTANLDRDGNSLTHLEQGREWGTPTVALPALSRPVDGNTGWLGASVETAPAPASRRAGLIWRVALVCLALVALGALLLNVRLAGLSDPGTGVVESTVTPLSQAAVPTATSSGDVALPTPSITSVSTPTGVSVTPTGVVAVTVVTGSHVFRFQESDFTGGEMPQGGRYRGRTALLLNAGGGVESTAMARFNLNLEAGGPIDGASLTVEGLDSSDAVKAIIRITLNNMVVYEGADPLANELSTSSQQANWTSHTWQIPGPAFRQGANTLTITNLSTSVGGSAQPFVVFDLASISW